MSLKRPGRGRLRLLASLLIAALLLLPCSAYADGAQETLDETIEELFERYRLTEKNFAIGFRALSDGTESGTTPTSSSRRRASTSCR